MKPFIVVADGFDKTAFKTLQENDQFNVHPEPKISQDELKNLLPDVEALVIRSATKVNPELLDKAPKLRYVIRAGEGTDNIDKEECQKRDIKVSNTPGANNNSAAEHAVALMLTVLRNTAIAHSTMKNGGWDKSRFTGNELAGKKIGIVGFGRIGQIVAKRLQGFEPDIFFYDRSTTQSNIPNCYASSSMEEIFASCDVVTLHLPLVNSTKGIVNRKLLEKMPSHAILVNASRGGIVDEQDLYDILQEKKIRGAGFDVYAEEPLPEDSKLRQLDNLVMTPHLGAATEEAQKRVGEMVIHQLEQYLSHNNLKNEVRA